MREVNAIIWQRTKRKGLLGAAHPRDFTFVIWLPGPSILQRSSPGTRPTRGSGGPAACQPPLARPRAAPPGLAPEGTG